MADKETKANWTNIFFILFFVGTIIFIIATPIYIINKIEKDSKKPRAIKKSEILKDAYDKKHKRI